jgi:hypothetical protein
MATPNLGVVHLTAAQSGKTVTINEALDDLDRAMADDLALDINNADATLTATQAAENMVVVVSSTTTPLTADRVINVPAPGTPTGKKLWLFEQTADVDEKYSVSVQVTGGGGAAVVLPNAGKMLVYCDGTDCVEQLRLDNDTPTVLEATTGTVNVDFDGPTIRTATLSGTTTIALFSPRVGKSILLDITGGGHALALPGTATVFGGGTFQSGQRNLVNILCINASVPAYAVTIIQ